MSAEEAVPEAPAETGAPAETSPPEPPKPQPSAPERDAVIFLAGLGTVEVGDSVDETARRIVNALEDEADAQDRFALEEGQDEDYYTSGKGEKSSTRRITVVREAGKKGPRRALVDLYSLDYRRALIGNLLERSPFHTLLRIGLTILMLAPKMLLAVRSRGKSSSEKWQVRTAWVLFFVLGLYALVVALAFLGTLPPVVDVLVPDFDGSVASAPMAPAAGDGGGRAAELTAKARGWLARSFDPATRFLQGFVVWLTAIGLFFKKDLKAFIEKSGVETVSASGYLSVDDHRDTIAQQFSALLNHLAEKKGVRYRNVFVVTYSFGGVIAIDALFPKSEPRGILGQVQELVTIACPFDFVRTYWPRYFTGRKPGYSRRWLNIYSPSDVLSSDFEDVANGGDARMAGVSLEGEADLVRPGRNVRYGDRKPLDEYPLSARFLLVGFRKHARYWEKDTAGCFGIVVKELFPDAVTKPV